MISSNPQSLSIPPFRWSPVANDLAFHPLPSRMASVNVQQPTLSGSSRSLNKARASTIVVAAWLTNNIRACTSGGNRRCTSGMKVSKKPEARSWTSFTFSPNWDGSHTDDQDSASMSEKYCFRCEALPGRGCKPVPGFTGEYHSDTPGQRLNFHTRSPIV